MVKKNPGGLPLQGFVGSGFIKLEIKLELNTKQPVHTQFIVLDT